MIKEPSTRVEIWRAAHALFSHTLINPAIPPIPTAPPVRSSGMSCGTPDTPSLSSTSRTEAGRVGCSEVRGSKQTRAAADAGERRSVTSVATLTISSSAHQSLVALRCLRAEEKQREMFTINYSLCCSTDGNLQC